MKNAIRVDLRRLAIAAWLGLIAAACAGEDSAGWPQWRGPTHDGVSTETGLADNWPGEGPPVLWAREAGQGYSSFIAVGDRIFTQVQPLYEQAVVCLDADTGEQVWSSHYGWPYDGDGLYPGPRATPTWHNGRIYFAAPEGTIGCLRASDGASIWTVNPTKQFRGRGTDFGYACSPVIVDGKVIVPVGGEGASVVALDVKDGSVVWKSGDSPASYASPLPITLKGRRQVIVPLENSLAAFDVKSGRLLWEDELSNGYDEHSAAPLYREPLLMIACPFRSGAKCLRLEEVKSNDGNDLQFAPVRVWETPKFSNDIASSVLYEGRVYGFDLKDAQSRVNRPSRGEYRCLDFETGKIVWSTDKVGHANAIVADGKLILFNDSGEVILARLGTAEYEELARTQVFHDEICWSPPALHRGRLFLRTQTRAACLYLGSEPLAPKRAATTVAEIPRTRRSFDPTPLLGGEREYPATTPEWFELRSWYLWSLAAVLLASACATVTQLACWWLCVSRNPSRRMGTPARPRPMETRADAATASTSAPTSPNGWSDLVSGQPTGKSAHPPAEMPDRAFLASRIVFWVTIILAGVIGSPVLNRWQSDYVFLWPLVLWSALQLTVLATTWAERQTNRRRARWVSRLAGVAFLGVSGLYFHLCRRLGLSIEWGFLSGYLPAFPVAAFAARGLLSQSRFRLLTDLVCATTSFTAYFAAGSLFIKWWLQVGS